MDEIPLGRLLLGAARESSARVCAALRARGHAIRFAHSALILNLDEGGTRLTTLAERAQMSKQAMSTLARELEDAGYLHRQTDPSDARAILLKPTARGHRLVADMVEEMTRIENEIRALFGVDEMATIRRGLLELWHPKDGEESTED